jgi:hypothetical protein
MSGCHLVLVRCIHCSELAHTRNGDATKVAGRLILCLWPPNRLHIDTRLVRVDTPECRSSLERLNLLWENTNGLPHLSRASCPMTVSSLPRKAKHCPVSVSFCHLVTDMFRYFSVSTCAFWSRRPSTSVNFPQLSFFWLVNLLPPDRSGPFNEKILFRFRRWSASRKSVTIDEVLWHIRNSKIWRPFIGNIIGNLNIFYIMKPIKGDYRQQYRKYTEITIVILYRK